MSTHDDFDINISQNEQSELSEKEYSDILGLEGMAGGGETALEEETEEEKEEDSLIYVVAEQHSQKQKCFPKKRKRLLNTERMTT